MIQASVTILFLALGAGLAGAQEDEQEFHRRLEKLGKEYREKRRHLEEEFRKGREPEDPRRHLRRLEEKLDRMAGRLEGMERALKGLGGNRGRSGLGDQLHRWLQGSHGALGKRLKEVLPRVLKGFRERGFKFDGRPHRRRPDCY